MRYTPNAVPEENIKQFLGAELARIAAAFANPEADVFGTTFPNNFFLSWFDSGHIARNILGVTSADITQLLGAKATSGVIQLIAKDAGGVDRTLEWAAAAGAVGGRFSLYGKEVIGSGDAYLRLNDNSDFASGIRTPLVMRADGGFDMGNAVGKLRLGATRGSINTSDAVGGWYGYQMNARVALLHDGANAFEIRDMVNSKTLIAATLAAEASLYFNNVQTFKTQASNAMLHDGTVFRKLLYDSGNQTISAAATGTFAHSLGYTPGNLAFFLECTTADNGYAVGDRVAIPFTISTTTAAGIMGWCNATNVGYARSAAIHMGNKGTGAAAAITLTSWRFRAIATL